MSWTAVSILLVMVASVSLAQLPTATIPRRGEGLERSVGPGVSLTARNVETGQTRTTISGGMAPTDSPRCRLAAMKSGRSMPGFRAEVASGMNLAVAQEAVVNFHSGGGRPSSRPLRSRQRPHW